MNSRWWFIVTILCKYKIELDEKKYLNKTLKLIFSLINHTLIVTKKKQFAEDFLSALLPWVVRHCNRNFKFELNDKN